MAKMKSFTVRRKKWARGGKNGEAALLNQDGNMCCLGFAACQISRIRRSELADEGEPQNVYKDKSFLTDVERYDDNVDVTNNDLASKAMTINDNEKLSENEREKRLTKLFRKHNIIIKFVD